jgi:hypothetical protein
MMLIDRHFLAWRKRHERVLHFGKCARAVLFTHPTSQLASHLAS